MTQIYEIMKYVNKEHFNKIYADAVDLTTSFTEVDSDKIPKGFNGLLVELATNNTLNDTNGGIEYDVKVNGSSQNWYGSPYNNLGFPNNMQPLYPMIPIPEDAPFSILARSIGASVSNAPYRVIVLLISKG